MKLKVLLIFFVLSTVACTRLSPTEKELKSVMNSSLQFASLDSIQHGEVNMPFEQFRSEYDFFSVVLIQDGCGPCYVRFLEWHDKLAAIKLDEDYTVLFVISGQSSPEFMTEVLIFGALAEHYFIFMDQDSKFLEANKDIPRWMLDASVLIDSENRIKMVGAPWLNEEMTELFNSIVYEGK